MRSLTLFSILLWGLGPAVCPLAKGDRLNADLERSMSGMEVKFILGSKYRHLVRESPIDGYVKFQCSIGNDALVIRSVMESRPSSVDIKTARSLVARAKIPSGSTGSRLASQAQVYIIFYNQDKPDKVALIFATADATAVSAGAMPRYSLEAVEYHVDPKKQ